MESSSTAKKNDDERFCFGADESRSEEKPVFAD